MAHHVLKIKKEFMQAKVIGDKPFEIRRNDRGYQKGDIITYTNDYDSPALRMEYEGVYEITYVTAFAQQPNWVVFGDRKIEQ